MLTLPTSKAIFCNVGKLFCDAFYKSAKSKLLCYNLLSTVHPSTGNHFWLSHPPNTYVCLYITENEQVKQPLLSLTELCCLIYVSYVSICHLACTEKLNLVYLTFSAALYTCYFISFKVVNSGSTKNKYYTFEVTLNNVLLNRWQRKKWLLVSVDWFDAIKISYLNL